MADASSTMEIVQAVQRVSHHRQRDLGRPPPKTEPGARIGPGERIGDWLDRADASTTPRWWNSRERGRAEALHSREQVPAGCGAAGQWSVRSRPAPPWWPRRRAASSVPLAIDATEDGAPSGPAAAPPIDGAEARSPSPGMPAAERHAAVLLHRQRARAADRASPSSARAPSSPMPVMMMPSASRPAATERNRTSTDSLAVHQRAVHHHGVVLRARP